MPGIKGLVSGALRGSNAVSREISSAVVRFWRALFCSIFVLGLAACGGGGASVSVDGSSSLKLSLTAIGGSEKATTDLIDAAGLWLDWSGNDSGVYYDSSSGALRIPAPANGRDLVLAVRRYDQPLSQGVTYSLNVQSTGGDAGAVIFPFDWSGNLISLNGGQLAMADNRSPLSFEAPANVAGFYVQLQSGWRSGSGALVNAQLSDSPLTNIGVSAASTTSGELISLDGSWTGWSNENTGVYFDGGAGHLVIPAPQSGQGNTLGVRRFSTALTNGAQYQLSLASASGAQAATILFLTADDGQVIGFTDSSGNYQTALTVTSAGAQQFTAPSGVAGFAVQVQSGYQSQSVTTIRPSLQQVSGNSAGSGSGSSGAGNSATSETSGGSGTSGTSGSTGSTGSTGSGGNSGSTSAAGKPRVIVVTDLNNNGGDPDDKQSLAHILWYANELDIRGIVPQLWNGAGYNIAMESVNAYEQDYWTYGLSGKGFPSADTIRDRTAYTKPAGIDMIIREADASGEPLYVLMWGAMTPLRDALYQRPDISSKLRVLSIASDRMSDPNNCSVTNWNGGGRNDIFNDGRFNNLWWVESNWTYNGMFDGDRPRQILDQISGYGSLGWYQKQAVSGVSWAQYFRAGDTPTVLYLIDPNNNRDNPTQGSWAGQFTRPFPGQRPNFYTDSAGSASWDYWNPCNTWGQMQQVYDYSKSTLGWQREAMYSSLIGKLNWIYGR